MKDLTPHQLAALVYARPFYADIERIEYMGPDADMAVNRFGMPPIKGALFMEFPREEASMFAYLQDGERYFRSTRVQSVKIFDDYIRVQTKNSVYALKNLKSHEGEKQ